MEIVNEFRNLGLLFHKNGKFTAMKKTTTLS